MATARDFYQGLAATINNIIDTLRPWRATVTTNNGDGTFLVTPVASDEELLEKIAKIKGFELWHAGSQPDVVVMPFGGSHIILGKIDDGTNSREHLNFPLTIDDDFAVANDSAFTVFQVDHLNDVVLVSDYDLDVQFGGNSVFKVDASTGATTAVSLNTPLFQTHSQSASDNPSTTSTVNYSLAADIDITLGTGTWTVYAVGSVALTHSAGSTVNMLISIDGNNGTARSLSANATVHQHIASEHSVTGKTGTVTVGVWFKSSAAGTTAARNPWLMIAARRTS